MVPTRQTSDAPRPILVLAPPGSDGQTVAAALGRHPQTFDLPVLNAELEATIYDMVFDMSGMRAPQLHGTLRALALLLAGEQSVGAVDMARRWLMARLHLPSDRIVSFILGRVAPYRAVLPVAGGLFSTRSRERIAALHPDCDIVVVQRDPARFHAAVMDDHGGAAALLLGASATLPDDSVRPDPEELLRLTEDAMAALLTSMPDARVHVVSPDDIAVDPLAGLADLAADLGLATEADALARMARPEASPFAGPGPYGAHGRITVRPWDQLVQTAETPARIRA